MMGKAALSCISRQARLHPAFSCVLAVQLAQAIGAVETSP